MMKVELGAKVVASDGDEVGTIDKLILDPDGGDVHAIVVHKGVLFGKDVEIPIEEIASQRDGVVRLRSTRSDLDALPSFHEGSYTTPPPERSQEIVSGYGYPAASLLWPSRWSGPVSGEPYGHDAVGAVGEEVAAIHREQDLGNAVIAEGSTVRSRDGEKIGEVHRLVFDAQTARPTVLVIRKGFLFTEDVDVPVGLISSVDDDVVYLDVQRDELERRLRHPAR
jgi:uncharacterized protein YrrD